MLILKIVRHYEPVISEYDVALRL